MQAWAHQSSRAYINLHKGNTGEYILRVNSSKKEGAYTFVFLPNRLEMLHVLSEGRNRVKSNWIVSLGNKTRPFLSRSPECRRP